MKLISCIKLFLFLFLLSAGYSSAQDDEPLRKDWLAKDVKNLELLSGIVPAETQAFDSLQKTFGKAPIFHKIRGFGSQSFTFSAPGGYTSLTVSAVTFNDYLIHYEVKISSSFSWKRVRKIIIEAWKQNSKLEFIESDSGIFYEHHFPQNLEKYKTEISSQLGKMKQVPVPSELAAAYENLISPVESLVVGSSGCGYGGVTPQGKVNIDLIVKARRIDLLENILRGYNDGGRVYAVLAFLELQKQGSGLSEETQSMVRKISSLDIKIETCTGCFFSYQTAQKIISEAKYGF